MTNYLILWISIAVIALIIDVATSSFLFVWFTIGAIVAIIGEIFNISFVFQLIIFIAASGISMAIGYPIVKKNIKDTIKSIPTREKTYIGKELAVTQEVLDTNSVKVDGVYWKIIIKESTLKPGDTAKIIGVEGNKILIKKI